MRYAISALAALILFLFSCPTVAQQPEQRGQHPMDGMDMPGMTEPMQRMMQHPMHRSMMMVHMLPSMQEVLDLSGEQAQRLRSIQDDLQGQMQDHKERMMEMHQQVQNRFQEDEMPSSEEMAEHFEEMAHLHAEGQTMRYEAYMHMRDVLTDAQCQQLAEMSPQQMHRHMMQNMSMMDMMQMMRAMRGGMMGSGMHQDMRPMMMRHHQGKGMQRHRDQ